MSTFDTFESVIKCIRKGCCHPTGSTPVTAYTLDRIAPESELPEFHKLEGTGKNEAFHRYVGWRLLHLSCRSFVSANRNERQPLLQSLDATSNHSCPTRLLYCNCEDKLGQAVLKVPRLAASSVVDESKVPSPWPPF